MKLERIRVEALRQFRQPLEIDALEEGMNVFSGPNEAGKSTLVAAIRAAFFERHRSAAVEDLRPWGDGAASPTVELDFAFGGRRYRLTKSFLARKRCQFAVDDRRLDGTEAEDALAELFGFRHAGKGASKAEHWGIPGLLWIEQGAAQQLREAVTHAADHLRAALEESLGAVASSGGDELVAAVEAARNELLTAAAGKPRGAYAEALAEESRLAAAAEDVARQIAAYRQRVDTLASLRREHAGEEAGRPWRAFREEQQAASLRLEAVARIEQTLAEEKARATQAEQQLQLLRAQLADFAAQEQALVDRRAAAELAREGLAGAQALVAQWSAQRAEAGARHEAARLALRAARREDARKRLASEREELELKAGRARETLSRAQAAQARVLELRAEPAGEAIGAQALRTLREQDGELRELQVRQSVAATRLRLRLEQGRSIRLGDETLTGADERLLLEAATLRLPGLGELEITPGGSDLATLRSRQSQLAERHGALLQRLDVASLAAAEERALLQSQRASEIERADATLKALAPQGIDSLHGELKGLEARAGEIAHALSALPAPSAGDAKAPAVAEAEAEEEAASRSLARIGEAFGAAQLAAGNARGALDAAMRELAAAQSQLQAPQRAARLERANRDLVDMRAEQAARAQRIAELERQIGEARPEIIRQDIERFARSAAQHERQFGERRDAIMRLEVELQAAGAQGLDERHAELGRDLAQCRRRLGELGRRARALDFLLRRLRDKRSALTRRLRAPLQDRLNHYLPLLLPAASLRLDEDLTLGALSREGLGGPEAAEFESLSFGAREQMGVISRLAYADLLREAGRPTLIILDDALVHSDAQRLARMKRVLFDAATRHQILLFTCHPENWNDLGVAPRPLRAA